MTTPESATDSRAAAARPRRTVGAILIALGLVGILWGVFHILSAVSDYESKDFAHRKRDYEVRKTVHERYPGALYRALAGLGLALLGARLRSGGERGRGTDDPTLLPPPTD